MLVWLLVAAVMHAVAAQNLLVASDASGQFLAGLSVLQSGAYPTVVLSDDYGKTWNDTKNLNLNLVGVGSSSNGRTLLALPACKQYDSICATPQISFNRGATWASTKGFDAKTTLYCFDMEVTDGTFVVNCHDSSLQQSNIYTSTDGLQWDKANKLTDKPPKGVIGKLLSADKEGRHIATINEGNKLEYSSDFGKTWTETNVPRPLVSLTMDDTGSKLFAFYAASDTYTAGLLTSSDGGQNWKDIQQFSYSGQGVVVSNRAGDRVLLSTGGIPDHLYLFDGTTTTPLTGSPKDAYFFIAADDSFTHIIAAVNAGFYSSHDGGSTWKLAYRNPL